VRVPSKTRLRATIRELDRLIGEMPDALCTAIEASGVVASWRLQLESLHHAASHVVDRSGMVRDAVTLARTVQSLLGAARGRR
jgi:hypothetical protein